VLAAIKNLIPFGGRTIGSDRITKFLSLALIVGLLQTFSWTYQITQAPAAKAAKIYTAAFSGPVTIPSGVSSITFTIYGARGGKGGLDCGSGCTEKISGAVGKVTGTFSVVAGDVIGIYPGYSGGSGSSGSGSGGGAGGTDTYPDGNYDGGNGGNPGGTGSSGGGGGGGAASLLTKNSAILAVAGGGGGAGGAANLAGSGQNGIDTNTLSAGTTKGGDGTQTKYSNDGVIGNDNNGFIGQSCTNTTDDGGGGGGGGGGVNGGQGGNLTNAGSSECSGLGGYRGGNFLDASVTNSTNTTDSGTGRSSGQIEITMQLSAPTGITATQTPNAPGSITVTWPNSPASRFRIKLYQSNSSPTPLEFKIVDAPANSTTLDSSFYSSLAYGTEYFVSVTSFGNNEDPYADSPESTRVSITLTQSLVSSSETDTAISFNGSSNQTASGPTAYNVFRDTFTASAWVYPTSYGCKGGSPETNDDNCQILGKGLGFRLVIGSSSGSNEGKIGYFWNDYIYPYVTYSAYKLNLNEWHHVAFSREGSGSNQAKIYIDGNLVFQTTQSNSIVGNDVPFSIGAQNLTGSGIYSKFIGQIDEVKVSSRARTQNEIRTDMQNYNSSDASFTFYYDFNENSGSTVYNRVANSLVSANLTISGNGSFESNKIFTVDTTTASAYTIVKFFRTFLVSNKGWKSPANINSIRYLVVGGGGGGGGGYNGGGGGAGGFRETNTSISPNTVYNIEVGAGGNGAFSTFGPTSGGGSTIRNNSNASDSITANGGGNGATEQQSMSGPYAGSADSDGKNSIGGSGGGGTHGATNATTWGVTVSGAPGNAGNYSPPEGYAGGNGASGGDMNNYYLAGGGGGGAGGAGGAANSFTGGNPGDGGIGRSSYITGSELNLAGGGAGAGRFRVNSTTDILKHGTSSSGGGNGACLPTCSTLDTGTAGSPNTGGGGGGGAAVFGIAPGGNGGSGFIAIRYITNKPTIITQPRSETSTVGAYETFTITTSTPPDQLTKSVQWQYTNDTITGTTGWENMPVGTGMTTDTFTTPVIVAGMNKVRFRAIVTFSDTSTLSVIETSTSVILTVNPEITFQSDTTTITRKYGDTQTVRTISYSGGTTNAGTVGTDTSHTVNTPFGALANGKIYVDTSTTTAKFYVDTGTPVGTYYDTITVTDYKGAVSSYTQKVIVNPADTLTVQADTLTAITYSPSGMTINPTTTLTGLVASDTQSAITITYKRALSCAEGGLCNLGDTGPGGGIIFYDAGSNQSWGRYIEATPIDWYLNSKGGSGSDQFKWCTPGTYFFNASGGTIPLTDAIGFGRSNRFQMSRMCFTDDVTNAVGYLNTTGWNGRYDWFLPTLSEMDALNNYANGALTQKAYWVSADTSTSNAVLATYSNWPSRTLSSSAKSGMNSMRPMRYVTPLANLYSSETTSKPTSAGTYIITPKDLVLANNVDTSNYVTVLYQSSEFIINKAPQDTLNITSKMAPYNGGTSRMKLTTTGGTDTGTVTYAIVSGGTASGCSISSNELSYTSAGTCKVVATKAATLNYLITYSDTVTITLSAFVSNQQVQTQSVPTQLPINGANSLETSTVTAALLTITGVTNSGGGAYTIAGTGFTNVSVVRIGGTDLVLSTNYTVTSTTAISITNAAGLVGPLFIYLSDGQQAVRFEFPN
jgi:hypothetical protein